MAIPLQTWGSLGSMITEQKAFGTETAEFLENNEVYDLFGHLLRQVIVHRPDNPIRFLQDELRTKPKLCVCVLGPPGINRSKYCQQIAQDYGIKHIHVGKILRAKKDLKEIIEHGALVEDHIVIELVKEEIKRAKGGGWVLDGYPRTKIQAQALSLEDVSVCIDKVLLLHTGEQAIRQRYAAKVAAAGMNAAEKEDIINARLQQYQRHVISIAELYKNVIRQIEVSAGDDDQSVLYNTIKSNLHIRPYSNAPLRSHRICIIGPCGSGRTSQCKAVAKNYGLVHIDLALLLRKNQKDKGLTVEEVPPEYVGDEELCALVGRRLSEIDCVRKGWVLDGFPKTQAQAEFLRQGHFWPSRIIHVAITVEAAVMRMSSRRIDPVTGMPYYRAPSSVAVRQRLIQAPHDLADAVKARHKQFMDNVDAVMGTYPLVSSVVVGEQEVTEVIRSVKDKIDTPVPTELNQDPSGADEN
jgi:adenylate kinase